MSYTVSVTMVNNGETTWTWGNQYTLMSQSPHNNTTWGRNRVPLPADNIAPGQSGTFDFAVTAPGTAGSYVMRWGAQQDPEPGPPLKRAPPHGKLREHIKRASE